MILVSVSLEQCFIVPCILQGEKGERGDSVPPSQSVRGAPGDPGPPGAPGEFVFRFTFLWLYSDL
jgi:hypothetical protein